MTRQTARRVSCGYHWFDPDCPSCARLTQWFADGEAQARPVSRTKTQQAHAAAVVAALTGCTLPLVAAWCAVSLTQSAGPWATFTGPQSEMTARFHALAREAGEMTGADIGAAA